MAEPLAGDARADVVVVGGGFTGLWTALALREREPSLDVVVLEADFCGSGPSGRNGGFLHGYWSSASRLRESFGDERALEVLRAADRIIPGVRSFLDARGADAWLREDGLLAASASAAQDVAIERRIAAARELGAPEEAIALDAGGVADHLSSPTFRRGAFYRDGSTVHPGLLVRELRAAVLDAGIRLHEGSPATRIAAGSVSTAAGRVEADSIVVAMNAWASGWRPVARRVTNFGSWIVLTAPAPDVLREIGWTGGEAVTDGRTFLHYFRTTNDGRVLMGVGAGQIGFAGRVDDRFFLDAEAGRRAEAGLRRLLPAFAEVPISHSWGGPIDVSADRLPFFGSVPRRRVHFGLGYTGNGVGPTWLGGQILASLALGLEDEWSTLPLARRLPPALPPEPLRRIGGGAIRAASLACEEAADAGRKAPPVARAVAAVPGLIGIPLGTR